LEVCRMLMALASCTLESSKAMVVETIIAEDYGLIWLPSKDCKRCRKSSNRSPTVPYVSLSICAMTLVP
jgi:hypothetical protein